MYVEYPRLRASDGNIRVGGLSCSKVLRPRSQWARAEASHGLGPLASAGLTGEGRRSFGYGQAGVPADVPWGGPRAPTCRPVSTGPRCVSALHSRARVSARRALGEPHIRRARARAGEDACANERTPATLAGVPRPLAGSACACATAGQTERAHYRTPLTPDLALSPAQEQACGWRRLGQGPPAGFLSFVQTTSKAAASQGGRRCGLRLSLMGSAGPCGTSAPARLSGKALLAVRRSLPSSTPEQKERRGAGASVRACGPAIG